MTIDRGCTWQMLGERNTIFMPENDHQNLSERSLLVQSSWCLFTLPLPEHGFQLTEKIVVMNPVLIADYDDIKKLGWIYFALLQELLVTIHTIGTLN